MIDAMVNKQATPPDPRTDTNTEPDTFENNQTRCNGEQRTRVLRPSVGLSHNSRPTSFDSFRGGGHSTRSYLNEDETIKAKKAIATDVAISINETMKTLGLLAALLSSWAVAIYAGEAPLDGGLCFGRPMVQAAYVVYWVCLGFFFLCVSCSLAIIVDLNGVPQKYLFQHLQHKYVRVIYLIPECSMVLGVIFLSVGYAMDIGERAGCIFFYAGCAAIVGFVGSVALIFWYLKRARKESSKTYFGDDEYLGKNVIATWRDRIDYTG